MTAKKQNQEKQTFVHKLTAKIAEIFKLGTTGKIDSFLTKVQKTLKRDIQAFEQDKKSLKFEFEKQKEEIQEKIEDAEQDLENAYMDIPEDKVTNNAAQKSYIKVYIANIVAAQEKIKDLKEELKELETEYKDELKRINSEIQKRKEMLENIA